MECEEGKYYIGRTERRLIARIDEHFSGKGSEWTKKYKPIRVIETIKDADLLDEDKYTKIYMKKYGIDNVRGGSYSTLHLPSYKLKCLHDEIATAENRCFRCGRTGHFVKECFARTHENGSGISENKCFRCGRRGHFVKECYARIHEDGTPLFHRTQKEEDLYCMII